MSPYSSLREFPETFVVGQYALLASLQMCIYTKPHPKPHEYAIFFELGIGNSLCVEDYIYAL